MRNSGTVLRMSLRNNAQQSNLPQKLPEQERAAWGAKIKPARQKKGMTQQELAEMSGVSLKTIGNIESGRIVPQMANLRKLMIALDLGPDPADSLPADVHTWLAILGPLIANLPAERRNSVMLKVVTSLGQEIAGQTVRVAEGMSASDVDEELSKAQRLGLVPAEEADNVHHLIQKNQGLNPDGMPPFDPDEVLAAREVPDELSSLRPDTSDDSAVDPDGPEHGA